MADYVIGDVQGCYEPLQRLLDKLNFNEHTDRLHFVGDLVNRGVDSLKVLRFIKALTLSPRIVLGNHDLHLLAKIFDCNARSYADDTLDEVLRAPDCMELGHWLRSQPILYHDIVANVVLCHAGIAPMWDLAQAKALALELECILGGVNYRNFLCHMYGNSPNYWADDLIGMPRLRAICNYFTRMRMCNARGNLVLADDEQGLVYPWYAVPSRKEISADIIFGHWAALRAKCPHPRIHAIDSGCFWGGQLTAMSLQDKQRFKVDC